MDGPSLENDVFPMMDRLGVVAGLLVHSSLAASVLFFFYYGFYTAIYLKWTNTECRNGYITHSDQAKCAARMTASLRSARSLFELVYYIGSTAVGFALYHEATERNNGVWHWWTTTNVVEDLQQFNSFVTVTGAFYLSGLVAVWWKMDGASRSDRWVLLAHHIVCYVSIVVAYLFGSPKAMVFTVLLHNLADIPLELRRLWRCYVPKWSAPERPQLPWRWRILCAFHDVWDVLFVVTWFATRTYAFPITVWWPLVTQCGGRPFYAVAVVLMTVLQCMHWFWSWMIVRALWRMVVPPKPSGTDAQPNNDDDE